tara:strand:+ start:387 stop:590 length:204 start_codon:yes stop_codon:yes gene_type:complete
MKKFNVQFKLISWVSAHAEGQQLASVDVRADDPDMAHIKAKKIISKHFGPNWKNSSLYFVRRFAEGV